MDGKKSGVVGLLARLVVFSLLSLSLSLPPLQTVRAIGAVRYAKPGGLGSGSCTSWSTACSLRYALNTVAVSGDEVWVAN